MVMSPATTEASIGPLAVRSASSVMPAEGPKVMPPAVLFGSLLMSTSPAFEVSVTVPAVRVPEVRVRFPVPDSRKISPPLVSTLPSTVTPAAEVTLTSLTALMPVPLMVIASAWEMPIPPWLVRPLTDIAPAPSPAIVRSRKLNSVVPSAALIVPVPSAPARRIRWPPSELRPEVATFRTMSSSAASDRLFWAVSVTLSMVIPKPVMISMPRPAVMSASMSTLPAVSWRITMSPLAPVVVMAPSISTKFVAVTATGPATLTVLWTVTAALVVVSPVGAVVLPMRGRLMSPSVRVPSASTASEKAPSSSSPAPAEPSLISVPSEVMVTLPARSISVLLALSRSIAPVVVMSPLSVIVPSSAARPSWLTVRVPRATFPPTVPKLTSPAELVATAVLMVRLSPDAVASIEPLPNRTLPAAPSSPSSVSRMTAPLRTVASVSRKSMSPLSVEMLVIVACCASTSMLSRGVVPPSAAPKVTLPFAALTVRASLPSTASSKRMLPSVEVIVRPAPVRSSCPESIMMSPRAVSVVTPAAGSIVPAKLAAFSVTEPAVLLMSAFRIIPVSTVVPIAVSVTEEPLIEPPTVRSSSLASPSALAVREMSPLPAMASVVVNVWPASAVRSETSLMASRLIAPESVSLTSAVIVRLLPLPARSLMLTLPSSESSVTSRCRTMPSRSMSMLAPAPSTEMLPSRLVVAAVPVLLSMTVNPPSAVVWPMAATETVPVSAVNVKVSAAVASTAPVKLIAPSLPPPVPWVWTVTLAASVAMFDRNETLPALALPLLPESAL